MFILSHLTSPSISFMYVLRVSWLKPQARFSIYNKSLPHSCFLLFDENKFKFNFHVWIGMMDHKIIKKQTQIPDVLSRGEFGSCFILL